MKRLFWMGLGAALALWGRRKTKQTVDKYVPPVVVDKVGSSVKGFVGEVAKAQGEARRYLAERKQKEPQL